MAYKRAQKKSFEELEEYMNTENEDDVFEELDS